MNYFLINNGFHVNDILDFIGDARASLIIIPHMMNRDIPNDRFEKVITFKSPFRSPEKSWMNTLGYFKACRQIDTELKISSSDTLFVYTEYEILNHYVTYQFKRAGAKVVLIEEGIAALVTLSKSNELMRPDWKLSHYWIRHVFGLKQSRLTVQSGICMPVIDDNFWDAACIYHGSTTSRQFKPTLIKHRDKPALALNSGCVLFVNQPIYEWYLNFEEYTRILARCLSGLSKSFQQVLFKFHPRETQRNKERILKATENILFTVVEDARGVELLYADIKPSHIASFFSTGLLNAADLGIQPFFFYNMIPNASSSTLFVTIDKILETLGIRHDFLPEDVTPGIETIPHDHSRRLNYREFLDLLNSQRRRCISGEARAYEET